MDKQIQIEKLAYAFYFASIPGAPEKAEDYVSAAATLFHHFRSLQVECNYRVTFGAPVDEVYPITIYRAFPGGREDEDEEACGQHFDPRYNAIIFG